MNPYLAAREHGSDYERHKQRAGERQRKQSQAGRDLGELPAIADPERRAKAAADLGTFCTTYLPRRFPLAWSSNHLTALAVIEQAVRDGGLFALAMPRGSGKTTLADAAVLFATLYALHAFVTLVAATRDASWARLASIKRELITNELLAADFPEYVAPVRALEGIAQRANGQTIAGQPTGIKWGKSEIVFASLPDGRGGQIIKAAGLVGAVRGMNHQRGDGSTVRPTLVVVDDPQTKSSAKSDKQCNDREELLAADILFLPGPGESISVVMPCTVIRRGDLADRMLDRNRHPEWQGQRTKMLDRFPGNMDLWNEYNDIRRDDLAAGRGTKRATEFYRARRAAMDAGAIATWPERFIAKSEISAIQHAMNLYFRDRMAFASECQNDPEEAADDEMTLLTIEQITAKIDTACIRRQPPLDGHLVTMHVDVHKNLLYWSAVAWADGFAGTVLDYGTWPEQRSRHFAKDRVARTIQSEIPKGGLDSQLLAALNTLLDELQAAEWTKENGETLRAGLILVDAKWKKKPVHAAIKGRPNVAPSVGLSINAMHRALEELADKPGRRKGFNWIMPPAEAGIRGVHFDSGYWKQFAHERLATPRGDAGSLCLYDSRHHNAAHHQLFAEHLTAEKPHTVESRHRRSTQWTLEPGRDNHYLDNLVGCCVAASVRGLLPPVTVPIVTSAKPRQHVTYLEV